MHLPPHHDEECKIGTLPPGFCCLRCIPDYSVSLGITVLSLKERYPGAIDWSGVKLSLRVLNAGTQIIKAFGH